MRLRLTFLAVACVSLLTIIFLYQFSVRQSLARISSISKEKLGVTKHSVDAALDSVSEQQRAFVKDYSFWDDMALATQKQDLNWLSREFYGPLEIYQSDAVWIISEDDVLYQQYASSERFTVSDLNPPVSWSELDNIADPQEITHFFKRTNDNDLVAYYVGPILYHSQPNTVPFGYMVVAKVWDAEIQTKLSNLLQATLIIEPPNPGSHLETGTAEYLDTQLVDHLGQPVAFLHFAFYDRSLAVVSSYVQAMTLGTALIGLVAIVLLLLLFEVTIIWPIQKMIRRLRHAQLLNQHQDIDTSKSELSLLTQEIENFIAQSQSLKEKNEALREADEKLEGLVSDLKKAESATKRELLTSLKLSKAVASASEAILITDAHGVIEYANPAWEKLNGYTMAEAVGQRPSIVKSGRTNTILYKQLWNSITKGQTFNSEDVINKRKDGTLYAAQVSIYPLESDHKTINYVGVVQDISARKERERLRSEFISLASHQLRTPLTSLRWLSELLQKQAKSKLNKTQAQMLQDIEKSAIRMIALVNRLLNLSRVETGRLKIQPTKIHLAQLFKTIKSEVQPLAKLRNIALDFDVPSSDAHFQADVELLQEIILNLISNALKYTPKGGTVKVTVESKPEWVVFSVSDTGIGIPKGEQDLIFTRFFRASNALEHDEQGTGLGLYLAKLLIESLGGRVKLDSEENKGTTVTFYLPHTGAKKTGEISLLHSKLDPNKKA